MATLTCQAIVLSTRPYGESDLIVSLFTLEQGRLKGFAKGARSSRKRFSGALMAGQRIDLTLSLPTRGLSRLVQVERHYPGGLHNDLYSLALLLYCGELVESLTAEGQVIPRLFRLFALLLEHAVEYPLNRSVRCFFEMNLLNILGYCPELSSHHHETLGRCLNTSRFDAIPFNDTQYHTARILLDQSLTEVIPYPLRSKIFLETL